jgi:hypothetical protein
MLTKVNELIGLNPFNYDKYDRYRLFKESLNEVAKHHFENCEEYRNFCKNNNFDPYELDIEIEKYPFLPVNIFKTLRLVSVKEEKVVKELQSSATTSGVPSRVYLDQETSRRQTMASSSVLGNFLYSQRHKFFILDSNPVTDFIPEMTARVAATRGFLMLAKEYEYFMTNEENGKLKLNLDKFIKRSREYIKIRDSQVGSNPQLTIFGFTFIVYEFVVKPLLESNISLNLKGVKLAHIGGWKKLIDKKVTPQKFKEDIYKTLGILPEDVIDFYGFTEQMGIVYGEDEFGKITPAYSEIIIRDINTLEPVEDGQEGFIQTISPIFTSYPGISVLTEDIGRICSRLEPRSGRQGTSFEILGRAKEAEIRGCGDLLEEKMVI